MKLLRSLILVAIAAVLTFPQTPSQNTEKFDESGRWMHGEGEPWHMNEPSYSAEQAKLFRQRWAALDATIKQTENEWEGDYHVPMIDTSALRLRWTQESGYVLVSVNLCTAAVKHLSYGQAFAEASQVALLPEFPIKPSNDWDETLLGQGPAKYVPVKWDGAHYLVRDNDLKNFFDLNAGRVIYNDDAKRIDAVFFVKDSDSGNHDSLNDVVVPSGYEKLIRKPIRASIIKVGKTLNYQRHVVPDPSTVAPDGIPHYDEKVAMTSVVINVGSAKGVKVGMSFRVLSSEFNESIEITQIFKDHSIGNIERQINDEPDENSESQKPPKISVGWKLTTFRLYW